MFDIHSHILPSLDDGAKDLQESLALLKVAQDDGITHMVATPHIHIGRFDNSVSHLYTDIAKLKAGALAAGIKMQLAVAAEVRLDIELMALVLSNKIPFIGSLGSDNYILLELPHSHVPQGYDKFINWLAKQGIKVIIPHPERNREIQANPFYIERLNQLGCDFQLTASSLEGAWGERAKAISINMLENNLVRYIASDAHSIKRRPPILSNANKIVKQLLGEDKAEDLFVNNPKHLTSTLFNG